MYICPVCRGRLRRGEKRWICESGHSFDIHRKGYVNLLTTKKHNPKNAGDNAEMVSARTDFLDNGYYERLAETLRETAASLLRGAEHPRIIDSGCGEGYYTEILAKFDKAKIFGIDISKYAISHCMTRVHLGGIENCEFAVASSFDLPFEDDFADMIVCTFAPVSDREYARVLKRGGKLIVVSPSADHLYELKALLYDEPYKNKPNEYGLESFTEGEETVLEYKVRLKNREEILSLYRMTPYSYKTSAPDAAKLIETEEITITCGFSIRIFTKKENANGR